MIYTCILVNYQVLPIHRGLLHFTMVSSGTKVLLICALILAVIQQTSCQLSILAIGIPQIVSLLENVNETSTTMSSILPQVANLLQAQEQSDLQTKMILQNQLNATGQMKTTLTQMASTQFATMATQTKMADALTLIANTQSQMATTQSQMSIQQTKMVNSLEQMASLLQIQSQHLGNISASLKEQNDILRRSQDPDCTQITHTSGLYTIYPKDDMDSFQVYCDMDTDGGGWTVFQRRFDGSVDFYNGWEDYEKGFGNMRGEHWLGLQQVHRLTRSGRWTLRIEMEDFIGNIGYAQYEDFQIGDAASFYQLSIGAYSGTAGYDSLAYHNGRSFSTKDSDHDTCSPLQCQSYNGSCTLKNQGAWWYGDCHHSNLNGLFQGSIYHEPNVIPINPTASLMCWYRFSGSGYITIKKSEMKIRRVH